MSRYSHVSLKAPRWVAVQGGPEEVSTSSVREPRVAYWVFYVATFLGQPSPPSIVSFPNFYSHGCKTQFEHDAVMATAVPTVVWELRMHPAEVH